MSRLSFSTLARFYRPLALSGLLMTLQQPVITAALSRTAGAQKSLAAYGLALSIAVFLESPIQMLLAAGTALARDEASFRLLRRFSALGGATLSGLAAMLAFTPLGRALLLDVLKAPPPVVPHALLALRILLPWPLVVAWRRLYQGVLIRRGETRAVGYATAGRLLVIAGAAFFLVSRAGWPGVVVGVGALLAGALAEALLVTA
jgi:Na+-driven multidrug efflux pump